MALEFLWVDEFALFEILDNFLFWVLCIYTHCSLCNEYFEEDWLV